MGEHYAPDQWRRSVTVAIVGLGVRGLGVLERLLSHASLVEEKVTFHLHLVDPNPAQPHQYDIHQPDYLLLNHACAYASMFPSASSVAHAPVTRGPNLFEWARERGLRVGDDGFTVGAYGRQVRSTDNLPRRVFGEYLLWFHQYLWDNAPGNVRLVSHASRAVDMRSEGAVSVLYLDNGDRVEADYVFLTVGQRPSRASDARDAAAARRISTPYPLPGRLESVQPSDTVAIAGLGLTATDAILALTVGRGGRFDRTVVPERYVASGREPRIVVFSRSGLPYRARPAPSSVVSYEPVAFTRTAVDRLRIGAPRLDFDRDVLPLLLLELRVAYRRATLLRDGGDGAADVFLLRARAAAAAGRLHTLADLPGPVEFDAEAAYHGTIRSGTEEASAPQDAETYQRSFEAWLAADLAQAARGFEGSPFKAATEMCREVRDTIRYAIEFGGLTDASLDRFYRYHVETINRLVIGPERERSGNILTLLRSGVVSMPLGPNPRVSWDDDSRAWALSSTAFPVESTISADWLYQGYTDRLSSLHDDTTLVGAMARRGVLRRFRPDSPVVSSIDVDGRGHPVAADGRTASRIWAFGLLCEGATFYNGYLTSPTRFERAQFDADHAVHELVQGVRQQQQMANQFEKGVRR